MRIVYCLLSPTFGMHQYSADLANRIAEIHDVHLVTVAGLPVDRYSSAVHIHTPTRLNNTGRSIESLRVDRFNQIKRTLEKLSPDIVHITGPHLWNPLLIRAIKKQGVVVIHSLHDLEAHTGTSMGFLLGVWNRIVMHYSDRIVVHGRLYRERLINSGIPANRVVYLPLLHLFLSYPRTLSLNQNLGNIQYNNTVLFFGRIEKYKGIKTLIEAFSEFRRCATTKNNVKYKLVIAGKGFIDRMRDSSQEDGIEFFNQRINDVLAEELFRNCSVVVLPYHDATQSAVIGAAYYFHKPAIVSDVGALSEYVLNGETGLVIPPRATDALVDAFKQLLDDNNKLSTMGNRGRSWYDEQRYLENQELVHLYAQTPVSA